MARCITITLQPAIAEAGFGTIGNIAVAGIAVGIIYSTMTAPTVGSEILGTKSL